MFMLSKGAFVDPSTISSFNVMLSQLSTFNTIVSSEN